MTPVIDHGPNAIPAAMTPLGLKGLSVGTFETSVNLLKVRAYQPCTIRSRELVLLPRAAVGRPVLGVLLPLQLPCIRSACRRNSVQTPRTPSKRSAGGGLSPCLLHCLFQWSRKLTP